MRSERIYCSEIMTEENKELVEAPEVLPEPIGVGRSLDLISDEDLMGIYDEAMSNLRQQDEQATEFINSFANMVINDGDSSTSSKEALVNLVKAKTDITDKMIKVAELKTRVKLRQPYGESKAYLNKGGSSGGNTINIYDQAGMNKRSLIDAINSAKKKKEEKNES
jgi:hypothetical protein